MKIVNARSMITTGIMKYLFFIGSMLSGQYKNRYFPIPRHRVGNIDRSGNGNIR